MRRMDRYKEDITPKETRSTKNQELYQDVANNPKYANITDVTHANAYEINSETYNGKASREQYQQRVKYQGIENVPKVKKELEEFNHLYHKDEKKIYDINSVLEEARKNRKDNDELEEKRKLKYTSYNILAGINLEELAKYREEKKKRQATPEEEGIHELMDTIASKTLAGELDKETTVDLLSDLMATSILDKVDSPENMDKKQNEKQEEKEELEKNEPSNNLLQEIEAQKDLDTTEETGKMDKDFYTKSMDLSEEDFEMANDFKDKGIPLPIKILIALLVIAIVAVAIYFIYQKIQ